MHREIMNCSSRKDDVYEILGRQHATGENAEQRGCGGFTPIKSALLRFIRVPPRAIFVRYNQDDEEGATMLALSVLPCLVLILAVPPAPAGLGLATA